jgi:hypothetical protein
VQIGHVETPGLVHCQNRLDLTEEGCFVSVEYGSNGAELNFAKEAPDVQEEIRVFENQNS